MITGGYIRRLRKSLGVSQAELAKKVGVSQAHIAKIENEKVDPRLSTINKILSVLSSMRKEVRCKEVMSKKLIYVEPEDEVRKAVELMQKFGISQLPVISKDGKVVGSVSESIIMNNLDRNLRKIKVKEIMGASFPIVSEEETLDSVKSLLSIHQAILVSRNGKIVGIVTKSDILKSCI